MKSVLVLIRLTFCQTVLGRITFPKNVIIEIPTTVKGNLECRYLGIKPDYQSNDVEEWMAREEPGYKKFVTEQMKLSEEERKKKPPPHIPKTEEILEELGSWGHYYDWGTKEIASWERKNPPSPQFVPLLQQYKSLKKVVLNVQKFRAEGHVTEFCSEIKEEVANMKKWVAEEVKAGRLKCECENNTVTKFTERYTAQHGPWKPGMFSLEKE